MHNKVIIENPRPDTTRHNIQKPSPAIRLDQLPISGHPNHDSAQGPKEGGHHQPRPEAETPPPATETYYAAALPPPAAAAAPPHHHAGAREHRYFKGSPAQHLLLLRIDLKGCKMTCVMAQVGDK
ncbi:prospero homeobox protein 1 [Striga asiatica]|uniref:Prospero homeobox protein 1 n=1 Tax=Striga asiatica TaxID=4170 RepID=A0A5A7RBM8_STRAF|nr:prospero homeobox protein 1 [Striga asiatica]